MKFQYPFWAILFTVSTLVSLTQSVLAEPVEKDKSKLNALSDLRELKLPAEKSAPLLVQESGTEGLVEITGVKLNPTETGVEVILQTSAANELQVVNRSEGNNFIADISSAQLRLSSGDRFTQDKPVNGISSVTLTKQDDNTVRLTVTGETSIPKVELFDSNQGLIFALTPSTSAAQVPQTQPQPETETPQQQKPDTEQASEEAEEPIELVVTATRTSEELENIPRSVTVIRREEIQEQTTGNSNLSDLLGKLVPGFGPPSQGRTSERNQTLRGRPALILIDGVPQNPNTGPFRQLNSIDPSAIERVEVLRGPSAIYGAGATGGIINIITRRPTDEKQQFQFSVGLRSDATDFNEDSLGYKLQAGVSGREGKADYLFQLSYEDSGSFFDADGDRIPPLNPSNISDVKSLNFLGKFGLNIDDYQRVEFTYNNYLDRQDTEFSSDPSILAIDGNQTARAIRTGEIDYEENPEQSTQVFNFKYTNDKIFGSAKLDFQAYYTDTEVTQLADDLRPFFPRIPPFIPAISQPNFKTDKFGTRLQLDTPFSDKVSVLWGVDYVQEDNERLPFTLDPVAFDNGQGRIIGRDTSSPFFELDSLGLFAQGKWEASEKLLLSGGVRYENISFDVDDYTNSAFANFTQPPSQIEGGSNTVDDVVFNLGAVYKVSPQVSLFTNFSQGFAVPNLVFLGRVEPGFDLETDDLLEPEKVNNFELGVRGNWNSLQFSLTGFYNFSDNGQTFLINQDTGLSELARTPQRNYGIETTLDWKANESWTLGGSFTWNEGDANFPGDNQGFLPLSTEEVQPIKLAAYLENETLPGWRNRLQLLYVGDRDRAFNEGVDPVEISGYTTLDFFSSLKLGKGNLVLGVENLLNRDYLDLGSQTAVGLRERLRQSSRGRTISVRYSVNF